MALTPLSSVEIEVDKEPSNLSNTNSESLLASPDNDAFAMSSCEQRLIQSSIACSDENNLELFEHCIIQYLSKNGCQSEILSEDDVNVCGDDCQKDLL